MQLRVLIYLWWKRSLFFNSGTLKNTFYFRFAPASVVGPLNTTWLYESLVDKWGYYLPIEAKKEMLKSGGFSLLARPGLRVISINNNIAYRDNW